MNEYQSNDYWLKDRFDSTADCDKRAQAILAQMLKLRFTQSKGIVDVFEDNQNGMIVYYVVIEGKKINLDWYDSLVKVEQNVTTKYAWIDFHYVPSAMANSGIIPATAKRIIKTPAEAGKEEST